MIGLHTISNDIFTEMCNTTYEMNWHLLGFFETQNSTFNKIINSLTYKFVKIPIDFYGIFGLKAPGLNINSAKDAKYIFGFSCLYTLYFITSGVRSNLLANSAFKTAGILL